MKNYAMVCIVSHKLQKHSEAVEAGLVTHFEANEEAIHSEMEGPGS